MTPKEVVVDSSALLAWLFLELGYKTVDRILAHAIAPVSVITEVLYIASGRGHRSSPDEIVQDLIGMGVKIESILESDAIRAAELIAESRKSRKNKNEPTLSLGDGLCIAVAERLGLIVTGGDDHWGDFELKVVYQPFR